VSCAFAARRPSLDRREQVFAAPRNARPGVHAPRPHHRCTAWLARARRASEPPADAPMASVNNHMQQTTSRRCVGVTRMASFEQQRPRVCADGHRSLRPPSSTLHRSHVACFSDSCTTCASHGLSRTARQGSASMITTPCRWPGTRLRLAVWSIASLIWESVRNLDCGEKRDLGHLTSGHCATGVLHRHQFLALGLARIHLVLLR